PAVSEPSRRELQTTDKVAQADATRKMAVAARKARVVFQLDLGPAQLVMQHDLEVLQHSGRPQHAATLRARWRWRPEAHRRGGQAILSSTLRQETRDRPARRNP